MSTVQRWSGRETRALREALRMSIRAFAGHLGVNERTVTKWEAGDSRLRLRPDTQAMLDTALARTTAEVQARFAAAFQAAATERASAIEDDEFEALELARRVAASDVGTTTLTALEEAFDGLAIAYQGTQPAILLSDVRRYLSYVGQLVDKRATLNQRRRLLVVGGWLSLLAATLDIDLHRRQAGNAQLATAASMADDAGHNELAAWCLETKAWDALTGQQFKLAADLSQAAQKVAPQDGSAFIQATAQEGRAWARLGEEWETRDALGRVERLVSPLPVPDQPEHHYRYDPGKQLSYTVTTLSWIGDPAAEGYAREVLERLESGRDGGLRLRRTATARLDLALALVGVGDLDEAAGQTLLALRSGRLVPSTAWRAAEILQAVEAAGLRDAMELRDAYQTVLDSTDGMASHIARVG